ncbi:MAG: hypothetical protein HKN40_00150 [Winogradskyella sp.]|uniref:hypothetical protein n=1 Tax=Winogradskyella sp. TaxID=1883156 RepID=UPI0018193E68|nr:hypothetical protein [Winogradskyella sp.]
MEHDEKKLEDFINILMSNDSLEQPSLDFTDNVMSEIEVLSTSKNIIYKPLIPNYVWWLIAASFLGLVTYIIAQKPHTNSSLFDGLNLPEGMLNPFGGFSINLSNSMMYAVVLLAIMVCIQVPLLKQYFDKRMAI